MHLPKYAELFGIAVEILSRGHFPSTVLVRELVSQREYETDFHNLKF